MEETKYNIFNVIEILQEKFIILTGKYKYINEEFLFYCFFGVVIVIVRPMS